MNTERRLIVFVLASLMLHSLVLSLMKPAHKTTSFSDSPLVMHIVSPPSQRVDEADVPAVPLLPIRAEAGRRPRAFPAPSSSFETRETHAPEGRGTDAPATETSSVNLETSARGIAQGMAREQASDPAKSSPLDERPILPALDRALKRAVAGEKRLRDGIIQITTEGGSVYCVQPPSEFARDTPVTRMYITTTCP